MQVFRCSFPIFITCNSLLKFSTRISQIFNNSRIELSTRNSLPKCSTHNSLIFCNSCIEFTTRNLLLKFSTCNSLIIINSRLKLSTRNSYLNFPIVIRRFLTICALNCQPITHIFCSTWPTFTIHNRWPRKLCIFKKTSYSINTGTKSFTVTY